MRRTVILTRPIGFNIIMTTIADMAGVGYIFVQDCFSCLDFYFYFIFCSQFILPNQLLQKVGLLGVTIRLIAEV